MSIPREPDPAKLIIGVFLKEKPRVEQVAAALEEKFGPIDAVSPWLPFDRTDYYTTEMGAPLFRRMYAFAHLIAQRTLADVKHATNAIEQMHGAMGRRQVNIDPGYMLHAQFVLATGKNYSHRIYIGRGIYADLTLMYGKGRFQSLPWTYPDYADPRMHAFLLAVRKQYIRDLRQRER